ncbi:MAG: hypothetical protein V3V08_09190 [Nannocystaceae bacterium]
MRFGQWYPLADARLHAPAVAGMLQVRVASGLVDYPWGKSAMIHYMASRDLRADSTTFAAQHPHADWLCRHATDGDVVAMARLVARFEQQFGARPSIR